MPHYLSLIIGATGHRDLRDADLPALRDEVRKIFSDLHAEYPHASFMVLSPLAAGADRVVASVALELTQDKTFQAEIQLVVPLPWPNGMCDQLIHRTGDRSEFDGLLRQAAQVIEIPLAEGANAADIGLKQEARARQYREVGRFIARHSQILIALWDGVENPKGGTSRIIRWQREGTDAPFGLKRGQLDEVECGPVYHVVTPRASHGTTNRPVHLSILYPDTRRGAQANKEYYHKMWSWFDRFNEDVSSKSKSFAIQFKNSKDWVIPEKKQKLLYENHQHLFDLYASADALAIRFQNKSNRVMQGLFSMVAIAVGCFEIYAHLLVEWWGLLVIYIGFLFSGWGIYWYTSSQKYHDRFVDYRALAEALRVQFFWRLTGISDTVSDHYLRTIRSELDWIRQALRSCQLITAAHDTNERQDVLNNQSRNFKWAQEHWVNDQLDFFISSRQKKLQSAHRWEKWVRVFYVTAIVLAVVMLAVHLITHHMNHVLAVLVFLTVAASALLNEFAEKSAFAVLARRYEWMQKLFMTANTRLLSLTEVSNYGDASELVQLLGEDALAENADWVIQTRERHPEVPAG
jgi:hypothetical protein